MKIVEPTSDYIDIPINHTNLAEHKLFIRDLDKIYWCHQFQKENDEIMDRIYHDVTTYRGLKYLSRVRFLYKGIIINHNKN